MNIVKLVYARFAFRPVIACSTLLVCVQVSILMGQDETTVEELKSKSLEELMQIEITTVSKTPEALFSTPAAVHVITHEEISRSSATTLPEVLRMAPNLHVAQIDSRQWAISARGFNGTTANKLLVLIDGRVVYTPLYSGVFWDVQKVFLEDIDRIEVISGPGGTLWGANAVNGVINIVTKAADDPASAGIGAYGGAGTQDHWFAGGRYGGSVGERGSIRFYGMGFSKRESILVGGSGSTDDWTMAQAGFRSDWTFQSAGLAVMGDMYSANINQPSSDKIVVRGGNILARYAVEINDISTAEIRGYFDLTHRRIPGVFGEDLGIFDVEGQHTLVFEKHRIAWGAGFRNFNDRVINSNVLAFLPARQQTSLFTAFIQDEITVISQTLQLTLGSKLERNHYTGFEVQPSARLSWTVSPAHFLWAAVSRSVRTPSRIDKNFHIPGTPPYLVLAGGPDFDSETLTAFEIGTRFLKPYFSIEFATFFNSYDDVRSLEPESPPVLRNGLEVSSYGFEVSIRHNITDSWRVGTDYTFFHKDIRLKEWSSDVNNGLSEGNDPRHQIKVHCSWDLPWNLEADIWLWYVDKLPNANSFVPSYTSMDVRLGLSLGKVQFSIIGRNLVKESHLEFGSKQIPRGVHGKASFSI